MRQGSNGQQVRAADVGMEQGIEFLNGRLCRAVLQCDVACVVDENVNLAVWKRGDGGVDDVGAKGDGGCVALDGNGLYAEFFDLGEALFGGSLVGVVVDDNLCRDDTHVSSNSKLSRQRSGKGVEGVIHTSAPALARAYAVANPMPLSFDAPVTMASFPLKSVDMIGSV